MREFGIVFGLKTLAWFDVWSIEHVLSGISIGHVVRSDNHKVFKLKLGIEKHQVTTRYFDLIGVGLYAFLWETIEHYLETGLAGGGVEYRF